MFRAFEDCTNLRESPVIPAGKKDIERCFKNCENLTSVTLKCDYTIDADFFEAFKSCPNLKANSIKVPAASLQTYRDNASIMGTEADRFTEG